MIRMIRMIVPIDMKALLSPHRAPVFCLRRKTCGNSESSKFCNATMRRPFRSSRLRLRRSAADEALANSEDLSCGDVPEHRPWRYVVGLAAPDQGARRFAPQAGGHPVRQVGRQLE